jgi:ABC-2 type transport system ATP-binding protein
MLKVKNISFSYDNEQVLDNVSLSFQPGEIHGILGANGAGKTTLFRLIYGLLTPTSGHISFSNKNINSSLIGYLETENNFYPYMKGIEYIDLLSDGNTIFNINLWNSLFKLPLDELIDTYSSGMKKKLALLGIISLDKSIMLLDEPFNGLDLETVENLNLILEELRNKNKTIVLTSHILQVLKENCDQISFLNRGTVQTTVKKANFKKIDDLIRSNITENSKSILRNIFAQ